MNDKYTVINKNEPRGQSIAENGIPCTAKYCVAELNRLFQDNENLETRLKLLSDFTEDFYTANKSFNHGGKSDINSRIT